MSLEVHGVVVGKFLPPHRGHHNLIEFASTYCARLHIIVCQYSRYAKLEPITVEQRITWLSQIHRTAQRSILFYRLDVPDDFPEIDDQAWAKLTVDTIGRYPDLFFSFDYDRDKGYAEAMRAGFVVPPGGAPIRATLIRDNPEMFATYLNPLVRQWYEDGKPELKTFKGYCLACKANVMVANGEHIKMQNGKPARSGNCPNCGTKIFKIGVGA